MFAGFEFLRPPRLNKMARREKKGEIEDLEDNIEAK